MPACFRCKALEARCSELEQGSQQLGEQLAAVQQERDALHSRAEALQQQLDEARLSLSQAEQQQQAFQSVQQVGMGDNGAHGYMLEFLQKEQIEEGEWRGAILLWYIVRKVAPP